MSLRIFIAPRVITAQPKPIKLFFRCITYDLCAPTECYPNDKRRKIHSLSDMIYITADSPPCSVYHYLGCSPFPPIPLLPSNATCTGTTGGRGITPERALEHVFAYGVGVDLTRRDMQHAAKSVGGPWDCSKGFDRAGPIGALTLAVNMEASAEPGTGDDRRAIWLKVNDVVRQQSAVGEMIWSVPEMIARLSQV